MSIPCYRASSTNSRTQRHSSIKRNPKYACQVFPPSLPLSPGAEGGPVCNHMSPNFDSRSMQGTHRRLKKTWVDIPDVGQKGVIQDGVQDGRRTLIQTYNSIWICPGVMNLVSLSRFLGSRNPLKSFSG